MGRAYKVERYSYNERGGLKRFLDVFYHHDGTRLFNLRSPCDKGIYATRHNAGTKLTNMGHPAAEWRANRDDIASEKLPQKRNKQEAREGEKQDWRNWALRWDLGNFKLVASIMGGGC